MTIHNPLNRGYDYPYGRKRHERPDPARADLRFLALLVGGIWAIIGITILYVRF